jgi:hypothetical protein
LPTRRICSVVIPRAGRTGAGGASSASAAATAGTTTRGAAFGDRAAARFFRLGGIKPSVSGAASILDAAADALLESPVAEMSVIKTQKRRWRPIHHYRHHI